MTLEINSIENLLTKFVITTMDGTVYRGIRPVVLPKPFKTVWIELNGRMLHPTPPPTGEKPIAYDAFVNVEMDINPGNPSYNWKIKSILSGGRSWITLISSIDLKVYNTWET